MKFLVFSILCLCSSYTIAGTAMKIEGSCSGTLADSTPISFSYYSNFNGCNNLSSAAVSYTSGNSGLYTGQRQLAKQDVYTFNVKNGRKTKELVRITFANSTGNSSGTLRYLDEADGKTKTVKVQCEVRDYEYSDC